MIRRRDPGPASHVTDDEITKLSRRFRLESIATLISVCRDERAPATARAQAATKLLEYSDGRPGQARQVTVADLAAMTAEQRHELFSALVTYYETDMPGFLKQVMEEADE